jgi:hypothetical protein
MKDYIGYAEQYNTPCLIINNLADWTANYLIDWAEEIGAIYEDEPGSICYVIQFPGRPQELYTENAIKRTFKQNA